MSTECYPISLLPNISALYRDFVAMGDAPHSLLRRWYAAEPLGRSWMRPAAASAHAGDLAQALDGQTLSFGAGPRTLENIAKLRLGARAVITGQQVGLLGGPLLVLLKAATAIARAKQATEATGVEHVPVFWCATEDHDLEEVEQVTFVGKSSIQTLQLKADRKADAPVGQVLLGNGIEGVLESATDLLGYTPVCDLLKECYRPDQTFGNAFARLLTRLFAGEGLIVVDASGREFHRLGSAVLRGAIEQAGELERALLARSAELETAGYHAQVLVKAGATLLFVMDESGSRLPLRRTGDNSWKAGSGSSARQYSTVELLTLIETEPERLSPNALLRPVFQDAIFPTTTYIGGPAEIAYFAQSAVCYEQLLGRVTPVLPRLSATIIEPKIAEVMARHEVSLPDAMQSSDALAQRLGARAMPMEAKRRLAAAGNALDEALNAAQDYLSALDPSLGRSAEVSGSKMRYQMNRLRRLTANFELTKQPSLRKHAEALSRHLFPECHAQERVLAAVHFVAAYEATQGTCSEFVDRLVREAANQCPGHLVLPLA